VELRGEGRPLAEALPPELYEAQRRHLDAVFASGGPASFQGRIAAPEGDLWFDTLLTPLGGEAEPAAVLGVARDITEGVRARERIDLQMTRLSAQHTIDEAITSSLDLGLTLEILLAHVTSELGVDAAAVLLLDTPTLTLEYAAGRGFRTAAVKASRMRLGDGHAGRAALERKTVFVPDLAAAGESFVRFPMLLGEGFVAYAALPLIAKGEVKGVLEVYRRAPLDPDPEWMQFLEALSTQAAIAIDNASLFSRLQRSNTELTLAYDATLEGWGRALELRDKETEGHTERVTEMTLRLARAMGVGESDLVQMRRGSFLHDVGKIGIPDGVLLKPEPLTEEEWEIMRRHPEHAFRLLYPIRFLRPALDIPYCHHERWDGSGYPRQLKGEQIPLAARIFSVVDVWDALVSDRPYHRAWPKDQIRDHLKARAGTRFDPAVVEAFLGMEW
ncbi:MAG: GAF domain-containing protein, partial [Proteobacteria bacterium]|nr:GAF domain-containing protein [Pseudomonadota bacterium]